MKRVKRFKFGSGVLLIEVYRIQGGKVTRTDTEYTDKNGVLRWMPPANGTYNLVCSMYPEYSITGYEVTSEMGYAEQPTMNME